MAAGHSEVRAAYRWLALILLAVTLALDGIGLLLVFHLLPLDPEAHVSVAAGFWLLRALGTLAVLLLAPLLAIILCNLVAPVFSEIPFFAGMRAIRPRFAARLAAQSGLSLSTSIGLSLWRMGALMGLSLLCLLLNFIPLLGTVLGATLQLYVSVRIVGWELLDPYLDKKGEGLKLQKATLRRHHPEILGMGAIAAPILAIPLFGPLFFGLLQAAAANFVAECIEAEVPEEPDFPDIAS